MMRVDLLHPIKVDATSTPAPPLTAEEVTRLQDELRTRERDPGPWPKEAHSMAAAQAANDLGNLYVRAGRIDDCIALWRTSALFFESMGHEFKAIAVWKKIQKEQPTPEAEEHLAALYRRIGL